MAPITDQPERPSAFRRALAERAEALSRAVDQAQHHHLAEVPDLAEYLELFYRHTAAEDVVAMDPLDLVGLALSMRQNALLREPGRPNIRVLNPSLDEHGWSSGHTVLEVVTDDMSFLVDSLTGAMSMAGVGIHFVAHPQIIVRRDGEGRLLGLREYPAEDGLTADEQVESWIHLGLDRDTDAEALAWLHQRSAEVLGDVAAAVSDWQSMQEAIADAAEELQGARIVGLPDAERAEAINFLHWLVQGNVTMLGYREYRLVGEPGYERLDLVPGTGLGILREDASSKGERSVLPEPARRRARDPFPLTITKANSRATVHRTSYLDYIGVKVFNQRGEVIGERRLLGLFTAAAYAQSVRNIPLLRLKSEQVMRLSGYAPDSHGGKDLLQFLETYPRDELFQVDVEELLDVSASVLHLQERRQTRLFLRRDPYERFASILVYLPRDRFNTAVRVKMQELIGEVFGAESVDYTTTVSESVLARLHFIARMPHGAGLPAVDADDLQDRLAAATRSWDDDFADALVDQAGEEEAARLRSAFVPVIPLSFKEQYPARTAVADIRRLDELPPDGFSLNLYRPYSAEDTGRRLKIYQRGAPLALSQILPKLQCLGVSVVDERPFTLPATNPDGQPMHVYDFGLQMAGKPADPQRLKDRFEGALRAIWEGRVDTDGLNALVVSAGLDWQQVVVLRVCIRYLRQVGLPFSLEYVELAVNAHPDVARSLVELFHARFDPQGEQERADALVEQLRADIDAIASADADRVLRAVLSVVLATERTNYFRPASPGGTDDCVSLKLRPAEVLGIPKPVPMHEIWVHSPKVEGVHLRFGAVARGGLRWSDRPEDFRTEILGLVKAQAVKNAVIVPAGAKGGFFPRQLPDPGDRAAWLAEGRAAYRQFVSALLDVTDNMVDGTVRTPPGVLRHDGDDPYLVVAADKGTATFSDLANEVSAAYGFWLGDAFASGGSQGYDHKAMGITARGAWESVKYHFRELGIDTQRDPFTAVGIGDMSGDVFGNGMLLSQQVKLVAAFDHRHIFLDPDPDPAASFAERRRLFQLPRSSWADYDPALISEGGGVHSRRSKSIPITEQVAAVLGLPEGTEALPPVALIRAVLQAPVGLLFNGGIGTYVKAAGESDADVGDKANDAVRIDAGQLRCRVVGEGGNLGFTQAGRIEAALAGVKLNTDAIDNSAGVDTSDHEVNIKILTDAVVAAGDLTTKQRNELLAGMTDEVAGLALRNNYRQNLSLAISRAISPRALPVHLRLIRELERRGQLDRALEFLPDDEQISERQSEGLGLTSPELSVLLAYAKISLKDELAASALPDEPYFAGVLRDYFPQPLRERFAAQMERHPLRRDIVINELVNDMVNYGGSTFAFRVAEDLGASPVEVIRGYTFTRDVFDLRSLWDRIAELDNQVAARAQHELHEEVRRLLDRGCRWLIQSKGVGMDLQAEVDTYADPVRRLSPVLPDLLIGVELREYLTLADHYRDLGVPDDLAHDVSSVLFRFQLLDVITVAARVEESPEEIAALYFTVTERFGVDLLLSRISNLPRVGRWQTLARLAVRSDLYAAAASLTLQVARETPAGALAADRLAAWEELRGTELARVRQVLSDIDALESHDLATLSVALRAIRTLLTQSRAAQAG
jgi:glutamate dehydrogenase